MSNTYAGCYHLTGSPVCGPNVTNMANTYMACYNLTGVPVFGNNVTNIYEAYYGCSNMSGGDIYLYSPNIYNVVNCFYGKNTQARYNLHVPQGSTTETKCRNSISNYSIVGATISWTRANTTCIYNTYYNIYIYSDL